FEEIERFARICVDRYGVRSIRLTGGEPTVRAHLSRLVARLSALGVDLSMTTNGATLKLVAHDLATAGLSRLNISLDSLRSDRFRELTRRDRLQGVLEGIDAAVDAGISPVKVNVVVMRGINDDEVVDFATFGRERGVTVRFIEFMPLDADERWSSARVVPSAEILAAIREVYPVQSLQRGSAPASQYSYCDGGGQFGLISSVSEPFCDTCDRVRLTSEGQFRNCLFSLEESDMRALMRSGADDDVIAAAIEKSVGAKWAGHAIGSALFIRPRRSMSQIGG
ncbi:MAG: GTP 3',8-cyclase MoaA, partial [Acidimicrobiales bacterium]